MNFNITAVFSPLERAELKRKFSQQKRLDAQMDKVGQQAARSYKSTVQVKRVPRRRTTAEEDDDESTPNNNAGSTTPPGPPPSPPPPERRHPPSGTPCLPSSSPR